MPTRAAHGRLAALVLALALAARAAVASDVSAGPTLSTANVTEPSGNRTQSAAAARSSLTALDPLTGLPAARQELVSNVTGTEFVKEMTSASDNETLVAMFYADHCYFSWQTWPVFEALAMSFPRLRFFAIEATRSAGTANRFSIYGLPTILAVKGGEPVRYKGQRTLQTLSAFVKANTGEEPLDGVPVAAPRSPYDRGPPGRVAQLLGVEDPLLLLAWIVIFGWAAARGGSLVWRRLPGGLPAPPAEAPAAGVGAMEAAAAPAEAPAPPPPPPLAGDDGHEKVE